MKKIIRKILISAMIISSLGITGCGSDNNKSGYSNAEKAAEQYYMAFYGVNSDIMMRLMPEEDKIYWENMYNVTDNQAKEKIEEYLMNKVVGDNEDLKEIWKNTKISVSATSKEKLDVDEMREINESLNEISASKKAEEAYIVYCTVKAKYNGETMENEEYVQVYEYDNKWYSLAPDYIVKKAFK